LRKLVFDFDTIFVFGVKFDLKGGQAAKIGASTGLESENNILTAAEEEEALNPDKVQRKPFFNWISAGEDIATARGGGGGLALWMREVETAL
jgi:hypothetical protein